MENPKSTEWTEEEMVLAEQVLAKIALCQSTWPQDGRKYALPGAVFEALAGAKKNISTELVVFKDNEVYLIIRPTLQEKPHEPYPGMLHSPGRTHFLVDSIASTLERIRTEELGGVAFLYEPEFVGIVEMHDPPRGPYLGLIFCVEVSEEPCNPRGIFYGWSEIVGAHTLVPSHKDEILPRAFAWWREKLAQTQGPSA